MISQPSTTRLIEVIRRELAENVLPAIGDEPARASVQMIDHILSTLAVRVAHEIAWMEEEAAALVALGDRIVEAHPAASRVASAVAAAGSLPSGSLHYDDVSARYSAASEVLSCAVEDVPADSPFRSEIEDLLDARLAHEVEIMGEFQLVGRT